MDLFENLQLIKEYNSNINSKNQLYDEMLKYTEEPLVSFNDLFNCYSTYDLIDLYDYLYSEYEIDEDDENPIYKSKINSKSEVWDAINELILPYEHHVSFNDLFHCYSIDKLKELYDYLSSEYEIDEDDDDLYEYYIRNTNRYLDEDFDVIDTNQKYTSAKTSINSSKLPAIFKMVSFKPGTINLDFGGGKFDNVADALSEKDVTNLVYDPYNRSSEHNKQVLDKIRKNGGADSVTCSNVLNVIAEPEARNAVIKNIYNLAKSGAPCYFTVYTGSKDGNSKETKSGYQMNQPTKFYLDEIKKIFPDATIKGQLITAHK